MSQLAFHKQPGNDVLSGILLAHGATKITSSKVNPSAAVDPTVNDDSSGGFAVFSLWLNTTANRAFICLDASVGAAVWVDMSGGSSGGVKDSIAFVNSFTVGQAIRRTGASFVTAKADSASNSEVLGILESVSGTDFTVVYAGRCALASHGFTIGAALFLSPSSAGALTETEPTTDGQVSKPVAIVLDANTLIIFNMRGFVVTGGMVGYGSTALTNANKTYVRGTEKRFQKITGTLSGPVILNFSRAGAITGDEFDFNVSGVVANATNTLTFQENGAGSLTVLGDNSVPTVTGNIRFVFNGTSWEIHANTLTQSQ